MWREGVASGNRSRNCEMFGGRYSSHKVIKVVLFGYHIDVRQRQADKEGDKIPPEAE